MQEFFQLTGIQILWRACNLTASTLQFHWSSGSPVCFPSWMTRVQSPGWLLVWNRDSPVSVVSLHWWPQCDWSLWPRLRRASSRTVTRPSYRQCDNPTWSHTALLFWFHVSCRSSFRPHNQHSRLLGGHCGEPAISMHPLHSSTGPVGLPFCFLSLGTRVQSPEAVLRKPSKV